MMAIFKRFGHAICAIGARTEVKNVAKTQVVPVDEKRLTVSIDEINHVDKNEAYRNTLHQKLLDRWLDKVVAFSGSTFMFFAILSGLLIWVFLGIPFGDAVDWQVGISDAQAILNMVFDSLLMRQQLKSHTDSLVVSCSMRSRTQSQKRMLKALASARARNLAPHAPISEIRALGPSTFVTTLPSENWLGKVCTAVSNFSGHIATIAGFWICIIIWLGFGQYCDWSSAWLFYINSATSALMILLLAFLANIRERHEKYAATCLDLLYTADAALELKLRAATGDVLPNEIVTIEAPSVGRIQRWINFYADLVGTLLGIVILILVLVIWAAIGPAMSFDSDWWLLIGTYAGLVGMNDGFVLRNILDDIAGYENVQFQMQIEDDAEMMATIAPRATIGSPSASEHSVQFAVPPKPSLSYRISLKMGWVCSHRYMVVAGFISIIGLIIGASALGWSITGQLLANVPPSIVESFFTLILITGHNIADGKRREELRGIYERRLVLLAWVEGRELEVVEKLGIIEDIAVVV